MVKENNTLSFSSVISGWTKVMKESHSRACLAQRRHMFLHERSLTKISPVLFIAVWLVPSKTVKFNHPRKFVPIWQLITNSQKSTHYYCAHNNINIQLSLLQGHQKQDECTSLLPLIMRFMHLILYSLLGYHEQTSLLRDLQDCMVQNYCVKGLPVKNYSVKGLPYYSLNSTHASNIIHP